MTTKTILITGATGNLGSHVLKKLPREYSIISLTRKSADLLDLSSLSSYLKKVSHIDIVIHIAGITDMTKNHHFSENIIMSQNLIQVSKEKGVKHFIFISSNSVNYSQRQYALSKLKVEEIIINSGIPYTILRPTLILSQNSPELKKLISFCKKTPFIPLVNHGRYLLQPTSTESISKAINLCLNNQIAKNKIYTLGGRKPVKTLDLVHLVQKLGGINKPILNIPGNFVLSILKLLKHLKINSVSNLLSMLVQDITIDNTPIIQDLHWQPTDFETISQELISDRDQT